MQTLHVNGTGMAYLEIGHGPPLVCVHGSLGDFRSGVRCAIDGLVKPPRRC
jgi:pimeloyl-ACP methyl ester carboxylesterase